MHRISLGEEKNDRRERKLTFSECGGSLPVTVLCALASPHLADFSQATSFWQLVANMKCKVVSSSITNVVGDKLNKQASSNGKQVKKKMVFSKEEIHQVSTREKRSEFQSET